MAEQEQDGRASTRVARLTQVQLALFVMALILFGGAFWTGQDWPRWAAIGLLVLAMLIRAYKRSNRS